MSYTRYNYDECRTKKLLQESTGPGRWILNKPGWGTPDYFDDPYIRLEKWGANLRTTPNKHPIDIASDLDGRTRPFSKNCSSEQYPNYGIVQSKKQENYPEFKKSITQQSRFSNPAWMYRDLEQTRWEYPLMNPQENICIPFHNNINTRILEKDNFVPNIPTPLC